MKNTSIRRCTSVVATTVLLTILATSSAFAYKAGNPVNEKVTKAGDQNSQIGVQADVRVQSTKTNQTATLKVAQNTQNNRGNTTRQHIATNTAGTAWFDPELKIQSAVLTTNPNIRPMTTMFTASTAPKPSASAVRPTDQPNPNNFGIAQNAPTDTSGQQQIAVVNNHQPGQIASGGSATTAPTEAS